MSKIIWWIIFAVALIVIGFVVFGSIMHIKEVYKPIPQLEKEQPRSTGCGDGVTDCKG